MPHTYMCGINHQAMVVDYIMPLKRTIVCSGLVDIIILINNAFSTVHVYVSQYTPEGALLLHSLLHKVQWSVIVHNRGLKTLKTSAILSPHECSLASCQLSGHWIKCFHNYDKRYILFFQVMLLWAYRFGNGIVPQPLALESSKKM